MDRKGIIAVAVSMLVLLVWQIEFAPKFAPPIPPGTLTSGTNGATTSGSGAATAPVVASASAAPAGGPTAEIAAPVPTAAPEPKIAEQVTQFPGTAANYTFTNLGGGISRTELKFYPAESGSNVDLNLYGSLPIGAISEKPGEDADLAYKVSTSGNTVTCQRDQPGGVSITKTFTLPQSIAVAHGYQVGMDVTFANHGAQPVKSDGYYLYVGSAGPIHQTDLAYYTAMDWDAQGKSQHVAVTWFAASKIPLLGIETSPEREAYTADADKIGWAAVSSQYFTTIVTTGTDFEASGVWATRTPIGPIAAASSRTPYAIEGAVRLPGFNLAPGQTVTHRFQIYAGPKLYSVLDQMGEGQERIITYYFSFWGMSFFRSVSVLLLNSMNLLHSWTGSYAIAIIILTLAIRGVLWPIQNRATASMRQMQALAPRQAELKEKYKDDPTRLNAEIMKLYKEYNVNPLAGCLPMFIQMPIFVGFYRVLGTAIELRNSKFLWVRDLSQPDTIFHIAGFPVNILPIFMAVSMFYQMSLTPKTGDQSQQRMMMFMPLIFVLLCYNFASALALYWTVGNVFSIVQMYVTRKRTARSR